MNPTLVLTFLRQRLTSPMRVILLMMLFGGPLMLTILTRSITPIAGIAAQMVLVFAAGAIGQDVSSGVLQLTFARPVSRPSYVLSRWLAASLATIALVIVQVLIAAIALAWRGSPAAPLDLVRIVFENAAMAFAGAAVMLALSACFNGLGDLGVFFLVFFSAQVLGGLAGQMHWDVVGVISRFVSEMLFPRLDLGWVFQRGAIPWNMLASWASTLTLGLALSIWRMNRRELSYAAD